LNRFRFRVEFYSMSSQLPPLSSLRAFASFVQHGSIAQAADALGLTAGAVNYQIHSLQQFLELQLVKRDGKQLVLTPVGRQYGYQVRQVMDDLQHATHAARKQRAAGPRQPPPLRLSMLPSFAHSWLLPRLPRLFAQHPQLHVVLHTSVDYVDFEQHAIDCAIRFGHGQWPELHAQPLMGDSLILVASPHLIGLQPLATLAQAFALPVLNSSENWSRWISSLPSHISPNSGKPTPAPRPAYRVEFNDSTQLLEALRMGMGVGLTRRSLAQPLLASGALVQAIAHECPHPSSYYVVHPTHTRRPHSQLGVFVDWLKQQTP